MPWFKKHMEVAVVVEAEHADEANDRIEEIWPANQPRGFSVEPWPYDFNALRSIEEVEG